MKKLIIPIAVIAFIVLAIMWMAGSFDEKLAPGKTQQLRSKTTTQVHTVQAKPQPIYELTPASIEAKQATVISSRILARVDQVLVRASDTVTQGDALITLDSKDLKSQLGQARAQSKAVSARLIEARSALSRAQELTYKKLLPQSDLDKARANYDNLKAQKISAEQAKNQAENALSFATIKAPITGKIVDRFIEPGNTAQPGVKLVSIFNPLSLRIEANVRESLAVNLKPLQTLKVKIPSANKIFEATIEEVVPAGNPGSRNFLIKCRLPESQGLYPGMYAELEIPAQTINKIEIPQAYLSQFGQLNIVWVQNESAIEKRFVKVGKSHQGLIEIIAGLNTGEQLIKPKLAK